MSDASVPFSHPWPERLLGDVGDVTVGGTPSTSVEKYWGGDVPWMASGDVHMRRITDVPVRITQLGLRHSNATLVPPPTVAVALAGQGKTRGTVALVLCTLCTNQSVALLAARLDCLDTTYLFHNLAFRYEELRSRSAGGGRAGLSKQLLQQVPVPLPPKPEQIKIADILSSVDQAIEQAEALIAKQQRIKIGLMQDLLSRGIDEHGNLRAEQTHTFKDSPLGRIPVEWDCMPFGSFMASSPTNGIYKPQSAYTEDGVPIVRIDGFKNGDRIENQIFKCVALSAAETMRYVLKTGDLLVNRVNSIDYLGKSALVGDLPQATVFESNMMRLRVDQRQLLPDFAIRVLSSAVAFRHFQRLAKIAVAQTSINQQDVCSLWMQQPCITEQARIIQIAAAFDACIRHLSDRQRKLRRVKTGLMQDLLTGKRRVTALVGDTEAATA